KPVQGPQEDRAHPAIHPTGEKPRRTVGKAESDLFDLIVRRFLAGFAPPGRREAQSVRIDVGEHEYRASGERTLFPGWMKFYGRYSRSREEDLPTLSEGQELVVIKVRSEEKFGQRPERFNQSSLLQRMESEKIGTKATRADAIATLIDRGYVAGDQLEVTDLGLSVIEALQEHASPVTTTGLTRAIESRLEEVESQGTGEAELLRETVRSIVQQLNSLNAAEDRLGKLIGTAASSEEQGLAVLGQCPVCKTGRLRVVRSRKSGKRFVGCSNYSANCRASAPLPQKGAIKATDHPCPHCGWPVVLVARRRAPWKLCVNMNCPGRAGEKR
ncbi:MAG TPA: DNA topoisomerase, partial [Nitrososphaerales archaeon]|nr:DNA topoisomerase [Nitrososphaerales archaeon]